MKKNLWLVMGLLVATGAVAQSNTNLPATTPAPAAPAPVVVAPISEPAPAATNAPVKIKKKKVVHHKRVIEVRRVALQEPAVSLAAGPAELAADSVNVRGQAGLKGEFITHLNRGDAVTVLSQINLDKHQIDEPAQWAKIAFPTNAHVWVSSAFIDATNKTVLPRKLNLRAGPGENYSVLGLVERGAPVDTITTRGDWTEIAPPSTAYAFIAAMYLKQESSGNMALNPPASTETQPAPGTPGTATNATAPTTAVTEAATITNVVTETNLVTETNVVLETNLVAETNLVIETNVVTAPAPETAPTLTTTPTTTTSTDTNVPTAANTTTAGPRIVTHEGIVRHVTSIIEPTAYELYDPHTDVDINYLFTTSTNLDLSRYKGMRIIVTGEETLAERWPNTPVLTVDKIEVVK